MTNEADDETEVLGGFDALRWHEIELPSAVRCVHCGEGARLEDVDSDEYQVTYCYQCQECGGWVEWEIASDDGDIKYSTLGFRESANSDLISQMEMRGWPFMWIPDGVNVPVGGQVK